MGPRARWVVHNVVAHPLLVLWPKAGEWLYDRTVPADPPAEDVLFVDEVDWDGIELAALAADAHSSKHIAIWFQLLPVPRQVVGYAVPSDHPLWSALGVEGETS